MPFQIVRNDLTAVRADAIVNTASPLPGFGRGTDTAVYEAAGMEELLKEREKIGTLNPGEAAVTPAFRLKAKYLIHTVGPRWEGGENGEEAVLSSCYRKSLALAENLGCESIAFPLISSGNYGFPKERALAVASEAISGWLEHSEMMITLVVFDRDAFLLSKALRDDVAQYIDDHDAERKHRREYGAALAQEMCAPEATGPEAWAQDTCASEAQVPEALLSGAMPAEAQLPEMMPEESCSEEAGPVHHTLSLFSPKKAPRREKAKAGSPPANRPSLEDLVKQRGESFQERLLRLIDKRGLTDAEVYRRANLDRKLFSKIRCAPGYKPSKRTVLSLAIGLQLNLEETRDLLMRAEFAFSPASLTDTILIYCIEHRIYNMFQVNSILFDFGQKSLA